MALSEVIARGAQRLGLMKSAVSSLDSRIAGLEAERRDAEPAQAWAIGQQIRKLHDERQAGSELLIEAEHRAAENAATFKASEDSAIKNLSSVQSEALAAAKRVDAALCEARDAVADCERILTPWHLTLLPDGTLNRYHAMPVILSAVRKAFESKLRPGTAEERKSFVESIGWLAGIARENAGRVTARRKLEKQK